ncbi:MAG: HDIG domain-containing protein [Prevotellaceae bacterium]|jgi:putative nucleotidyltransferase with HDIG domain|nr:HDIG domain-containing protein [Prevotellaceae bacterium]
MNSKRKFWKLVVKIVLFAFLAFIITQLFPRKNKFKYYYETGHPWTYDLVTATFDFPIYKSEKQIETEKEELLSQLAPYFLLNTAKAAEQLNLLFRNQLNLSDAGAHLQIQELFYKIYSTGIISVESYENLQKRNISKLTAILPDRTTKSLNVKDLYTPKSAYELIKRSMAENINLYNINEYLVENLKYDSATTELSHEEALKNLSLTTGIVQTGELIIGRGEIVTPATYQILESLKKEYENRLGAFKQSTVTYAGELMAVAGLLTLLAIYLKLFRPRVFGDIRNLLMLALNILFLVLVTSLIIRYTNINYYIVPFALLPIVIRVFFDSRTALFTHIISMMIISFIVDDAFQFLLLQIAAGMTAVSSLKDMTQRSQLVQSAMLIFLTYLVGFLASEFIFEGELSRVHWMMIVYFSISTGFLLFAYLLVYVLEKMFGLISSVTLVELTNVNSDLMMRFAEVAPGTFQHSLQVSNLATEAAKKINANSLLVRTGALYHDIGKMNHPEYFIENQGGGKNPLTALNPIEAAKIIISHVTDGIDLANKNHLPQQIIHFITTHHGLSQAKYFYNSYINQHPDETVDRQLFTYPGPLPDSRETAILMMADAVEARSRSLNQYTEESIDKMVEQMIDSQIADGQLRNSNISFKDVEEVKVVFKHKIRNMYHTRIAYPEVKKQAEAKKESESTDHH